MTVAFHGVVIGSTTWALYERVGDKRTREKEAKRNFLSAGDKVFLSEVSLGNLKQTFCLPHV